MLQRRKEISESYRIRNRGMNRGKVDKSDEGVLVQDVNSFMLSWLSRSVVDLALGHVSPSRSLLYTVHLSHCKHLPIKYCPITKFGKSILIEQSKNGFNNFFFFNEPSNTLLISHPMFYGRFFYFGKDTIRIKVTI